MSGDSGLEKRLLVLMGARLALSLVSLGIAVALEAAGWSYSPSEWRGFYGTVIFAFVATIGYGLILRRVRRVKRFVVLNIATDIAIVSALVHLSGGADSPFAFLYVLIGAYGAILLERKGALICAVAGALVYGSVILVGQQELLPQHAIGPRDPAPVLLSTWVVTAAGVVSVAWLASLLSAELRRAGEALEQRTSDLSRLQTLHERTVESLKSGLLTTDLEGRITSFNSEAERITSQDRASVLGTDAEAILPGLRDQLVAGFRRHRGRQLEYARADGLPRAGRGPPLSRDWNLCVAGWRDWGSRRPCRDLPGRHGCGGDGGQSAPVRAACSDWRTFGQHCPRNPEPARGNFRIHRDAAGRKAGSAESADSEHLMKIVMREVDRLNHLISDFLNYARPRPSKPETFPVQEIISGVLEMFDAARPEAIEIEFEVEDGLTVFADADQLRQLLWNLVLNASESMPDGGRLRVSARSLREGDSQEDSSADRKGHGEEEGKARWLEIAVADDGSGIPQEKLDRIFDPFFTTKQNGSGLGLATVHRIVQNHGGSVRLESELGVGTTVRIRLPRTGETV